MIGAAVRIRHYEEGFTGRRGRFVGRLGIVQRPNSVAGADYVYVRLLASGRAKERVELLRIDRLEVLP